MRELRFDERLGAIDRPNNRLGKSSVREEQRAASGATFRRRDRTPVETGRTQVAHGRDSPKFTMVNHAPMR